MFSLLYGLYQWLTWKEELRFLIVGIDNAGKTTTFETIKHIFASNCPKAPLDRIIPTVGLNLCNVRFDRMFNGVFWDLGGQLMLRAIWENHYKECDGLIFVIDSTDVLRMREVYTTLDAVLNHPAFHGRSVPVVILLNKQDRSGLALPLSNAINMIGLQNILQYAKVLEYGGAHSPRYALVVTGNIVPKEVPNHYNTRNHVNMASSRGDVTKKRAAVQSMNFTKSRNASFGDASPTTMSDNYPEILCVAETSARIVCVAGCSATKNINIKEALTVLVEDAKARRLKTTLN